MLNQRKSDVRLANPTEQVVLDVPARRSRRLVRLLVGSAVLVSMVCGVLGILSVLLPPEERWLALTALAGVMVLGSLFVGLTDYAHGRCVSALVQAASGLRTSAAERASELARLNAELRQRSAERSSLLAMLAHELRTPLSSILGYCRVLLDEIDGPLNDEQRADLDQIQQSGDGMLNLVNGTLELARLDAGAVMVTPGPVQLLPLVEAVSASLRPLALARGLEIEGRIPSGLPPVTADESALRQVLTNLIGNAVKFTDLGGVRIGVQSGHGQVTISVADTGVGIARDAQALVFEPFRQAGAGAARRQGGVGLGLAISRRLVDLMDGQIWLESEPGRGSTFYVQLPIAAIRPAEPAPPRRGVTLADVLVAGEAERTGVLVEVLAERGIVGRQVDGGNIQRDLLETTPRLLLADARLTRARAWRLLAEVRACQEHDDVRVGLIDLEAGGGRLVAPDRLDVLAARDLESALSGRIASFHAPGDGARRDRYGRVVVVSADLGWRRRAAHTLEGAGVRVVDAAGVCEAISAARRTPVRGFVVDLLLPDPHALQLLHEIATDPQWSSLPVLVLAPAALTPSEQAELRRGLQAWTGPSGMPLGHIADEVARKVASPARATATA